MSDVNFQKSNVKSIMLNLLRSNKILWYLTRSYEISVISRSWQIFTNMSKGLDRSYKISQNLYTSGQISESIRVRFDNVILSSEYLDWARASIVYWCSVFLVFCFKFEICVIGPYQPFQKVNNINIRFTMITLNVTLLNNAHGLGEK